MQEKAFKMKILAISDIHGSKILIYGISQIIKKNNIDALIIAGDIMPKGFYQICNDGPKPSIQLMFPLKNKENILVGNIQKIETKLDLLGFLKVSKNNPNLPETKLKLNEKLIYICKLLNILSIPVYMLIGNDDHISHENWDKILNEYGIFNLNIQTHTINNLKIVGFQYIPPTPWNTNNELPENKLAEKLISIEKQVDKKTILVTHGPPKDILDKLTNGLHVGSSSILRLVNKKQPCFHIFGHIHEAFGQDKFNDTLCFNVSSLWLDQILRGYIIDTDNNTYKKIEQRMPLKDII